MLHFNFNYWIYIPPYTRRSSYVRIGVGRLQARAAFPSQQFSKGPMAAVSRTRGKSRQSNTRQFLPLYSQLVSTHAQTSIYATSTSKKHPPNSRMPFNWTKILQVWGLGRIPRATWQRGLTFHTPHLAQLYHFCSKNFPIGMDLSSFIQCSE